MTVFELFTNLNRLFDIIVRYIMERLGFDIVEEGSDLKLQLGE